MSEQIREQIRLPQLDPHASAQLISEHRFVLLVYGFKSRSKIFHLYGDVTITGEGLQTFWPMFSVQEL
jgi:hypothetical protein